MWVVELRPQESMDELTKESLAKDDIFDLWSLLNHTTENELRDLFADWINKKVKKRMDYYNLVAIQMDIMRLKNNEIDVFDDNKDRLNLLTIWMILFDNYANLIEEKIWNRLDYNDMNDIMWIHESIKLISPLKNCSIRDSNEKKVRNIWMRFLLTEVRNAIMHKNFIITEGKLYIKSKNARKRRTNKKDENWNFIMEEQDFEAIIDRDFFLKALIFCKDKDRKFVSKSIYSRHYDWKKWYEANKDNIKRRIVEAKQKWEIRDTLKERVDSIDITTVSEKKLTNGQKELFSKYFTEKGNEFNPTNLQYVDLFSNFNDNRIPIWLLIWEKKDLEWHLRFHIEENLKLYWEYSILKSMLEAFTEWKEENRKLWESNKKIEEFFEYKLWKMVGVPANIYDRFKNYEAKKYLWDSEFVPLLKIIPKDQKEQFLQMIKDIKIILSNVKKIYLNAWEYLRLYLMTIYISMYMVNNPELKLWERKQREWDHLWNQWRDYIIDKAKKEWNVLWSKEAKEKSLNRILWDSFRRHIAKHFTTALKIENWPIRKDDEEIREEIRKLIYERNDSKNLYWLRKLSIWNKQIIEENIFRIVKQWKSKLEKIKPIDEDEHIRNAFAHHNYTFIPWCDHILLRDPSINDAPDREKVYNLEALYKKCLLTTYEKYLKKEEDI